MRQAELYECCTAAYRNIVSDPKDLPEFYSKEDDKYIWTEDKKLGWCFESEIYSCYSIRNKDHAGSEHEDFPFVRYTEMITLIKEELGK